MIHIISNIVNWLCVSTVNTINHYSKDKKRTTSNNIIPINPTKKENIISHYERKQIKIKDDINLNACKFGDRLKTTEGDLAIYISKHEEVCFFDNKYKEYKYVHNIVVKTEFGICFIEAETQKSDSSLNEID